MRLRCLFSPPVGTSRRLWSVPRRRLEADRDPRQVCAAILNMVNTQASGEAA